MRDGRDGNLLEVVGRKPVVVGAHERLEVAPGLARDHAEQQAVLLIQSLSSGLDRPAQPRGDDRRGEPEREDRALRRAGQQVAHRQR